MADLICPRCHAFVASVCFSDTLSERRSRQIRDGEQRAAAKTTGHAGAEMAPFTVHSSLALKSCVLMVFYGITLRLFMRE
jgi:hypothetical protein